MRGGVIGRGLAGFAGASVMFMGSPAAAQQAADQQETSAFAGDIVVTARKREETLQNIPMSISAVSGEALVRSQATNIAAVQSLIPGINIAPVSLTETLISIRGVGLSVPSGSLESSVAVHIDGAYQARPFSLNANLYDIANVQVLRGPQGTLYGRNSIGGTINFVTAAPTRELSYGAQATFGNIARPQIDGFISGPISDTLSLRLAGTFDDSRGFIKNRVTGNNLGGHRTYAARAKLRWEPSDDVTVDLTGSFLRDKQRGSILQYANVPGLVDQPGRVSTNPKFVDLDTEPLAHRRENAVNLQMAWNVSDEITLKSLTSYVHGSINSIVDQDISALKPPVDISTSTVGTQHFISDTYQQEFTANYDSGDLHAVLGAFAYSEKLRILAQDAVIDFGLPAVFPPDGKIIAHQTVDPQRNSNISAYLDFTLPIADGLSLYGGARIGRDTVKMRNLTFFNPLCDVDSDQVSFTRFTPKIGAQYKFSGTSQVYGQFQRGFKSGNMNFEGCTGPGLTRLEKVDPETIDAYEVGYKGQLFDNRVRLALSGFYYDYKNLQTLQVTPPTPISKLILTNAASSRIYGGEAEITLNPIDTVRLTANLSLLHARYRKYLNVDAQRPQDGEQDLSGRPLNQAPDATINFAADWTIPVAAGNKIELRGEYFHSSRTWLREFPRPEYSQSPYALINLFATYRFNDEHMFVKAFVRNLTDKRVIRAQISGPPLGVTSFLGDGRSYGIQAGFRF